MLEMQTKECVITGLGSLLLPQACSDRKLVHVRGDTNRLKEKVLTVQVPDFPISGSKPAIFPALGVHEIPQHPTVQFSFWLQLV